MLTLIATAALVSCTPAPQEPPPGMLLVEGGRTEIGSDKKDIEEIVQANASAEEMIRAIDAETPKHKVDVSSFYLMQTEVTNEQYAEFVKATGHKPPYVWGEEALAVARDEFLRNPDNKGLKFDPEGWWEDNWEGATWAIAPKDLLRPVIFVDYQDAVAYCRWAGLRLPTEEEYQRACRGKTAQLYPWGDEWADGEYCMSREYRKKNEIQLAGTFPKGAGPYGHVDLAGNVWEWTSSPYVAYEGFKANTYKLSRKEKVTPTARWDGDNRVVVGGSYQNNKVAARCTTRRGTPRTERTSGVGLRAAASLAVGVDKAEAIYQDRVRNSRHRPNGVTFDMNLSVSLEHWGTRSTAADKKSMPGEYTVPADYRVITGHDHLIFLPVSLIEEGNDGTWRRQSVDEAPIVLGVLSMTEKSLSPALEPGVYFVKYRSKGKPKRTSKDDEKEDVGDAGGADEVVGSAQDPEVPAASDEWMDEVDLEEELLLFFDVETGALAGSHVLKREIGFEKAETPGWFDATEKVEVLDEKGKPKFVDEPRLRLHAEIPHRLRGKVVPVDLLFQFDAATLGKAWRGKR